MIKSKEIIGILAYNILFPGIEAGGKKRDLRQQTSFYISLYSSMASKQGQDLWTFGKYAVSQNSILFPGIKAGARFMNIGEITMTEDDGIGIAFLQVFKHK